MAILFPSIEQIKKLKVKPTDGELFLINYLADNLSEDVELYFQPYFNGDRPDIVLIEKDVGVTIIEVKDWELNSYYLDEKGDWHIKHDNTIIKSPFKQIFHYKDSMFNLHINGLLEKKILDKRFYGRISVFVYFHNVTESQLKQFYRPLVSNIEDKIRQERDNKNQKALTYLINLHKKILKQRDVYAKTIDSLHHMKLPQKVDSLFPESIYREFSRYLQPPFHTKEEGSHINYTKKQLLLSESIPKYQKVKGVAGAGKTLILAKRAVNAYMRHGGDVLILTFNITLTSYIHDMISNVREDFSWSIFTILNYHHFFTMMANRYGLKIEKLSDYGNEDFFLNKHTKRYKTILIDEIQDYERPWIHCIKKSFLEDNGEFLVLGDEKQNIYERTLDADKRPYTSVGGQWNLLQESFRLNTQIASLAEKFQKKFFNNKYEIDTIKSCEGIQHTINFEQSLIEQKTYDVNDLSQLIETIFRVIKENNIHPNDICILAYHIELLRELDFLIRKKFNEKTLTTFETKEVFEHLQKNTILPEYFKSEIDNVRRVKKYGFRLNGGTVKLSTIHSFKGWEIPTLFLIIDNDLDESIYTALTRARENLIIFNLENSKYTNFFSQN